MVCFCTHGPRERRKHQVPGSIVVRHVSSSAHVSSLDLWNLLGRLLSSALTAGKENYLSRSDNFRSGHLDGFFIYFFYAETFAWCWTLVLESAFVWLTSSKEEIWIHEHHFVQQLKCMHLFIVKLCCLFFFYVMLCYVTIHTVGLFSFISFIVTLSVEESFIHFSLCFLDVFVY